MKTIMALLSLLLFTSHAEKKSLEIPAIFSDNMVLQQNTSVSFWGKGEPGLPVNVKGSWGEAASGKTDNEGKYLVKLKTPAAGGPFEVTLSVGDSAITYKNVLAGEVWLCSGQSNMEMPLAGWPPSDTIQNSAQEIAGANYDKIRMFTVSRAFSHEEEFNCSGNWQVCNPRNAPGFSATAYFFGKKLMNELNVPVGLIHSSWGGTPVEAWTNGKHIASIEQFKKQLDDIKESGPQYKQYTEWLHSHPIIDIAIKPAAERWDNLQFDDAECSNPEYNDGNWKEMELPGVWETKGLDNFDGAVWYRKKIELPPTWANKDLVIELGPIDDMDRTFINGKMVGNYEKDGFWNKDRVYKIPKETINSKIITIAVRVIDPQGGGGLYGTKDKLKISTESGDSISLSGLWKYLPVSQYSEQKFFVFGSKNNNFDKRPELSISLGPNTPTALYNGMISPLVPYTLKGAIWYQGEANTGNPELYAKQLPLMIKNWRDVWQLGDFPFYYVQIAPYDYGEGTPSQKLRESQLKTMSYPHTGMVVTLDIGNPKNIHPANKKDVGERLALWALAKDYGKKVEYSGPVYKSMKSDDDKIILSFDYAENGLMLKELNGENNFLIAGEDKVFKKAVVIIENNQLIVKSPEIKKPAAVRYAWDNISEGTLFNSKGLPASSFRTDNWE